MHTKSIRLPPLYNVPKEKLRTNTHRINEALQYIDTENIEQTNKLIYAAARHACTECCVNKYMLPWQRRIEGKILQLRKYLSRIHEMESVQYIHNH